MPSFMMSVPESAMDSNSDTQEEKIAEEPETAPSILFLTAWPQK